MDMWRHKSLVHGEAYSEDILMYALTEQNHDLDIKVRNLEQATRENTAELRKVVELVIHEVNAGVSKPSIVENQAELIIDNLSINRKIEDLAKLSKMSEEESVKEPAILWVGTSLSDQHLDVRVLEKKTGMKVDKLKSFTITRADGKMNPNINAEELIPKALSNRNYDIMVAEIGVNEVSNLDVRRSQEDLKVEMQSKMEKLFHLSLQYITDYPNLKVVLLDRLPRLDSTAKADMGREADLAMAKLWEENGQPEGIILESLHLQVNTEKEKEEVFGRQVGKKSFGIHYRGTAGNKEFTYRAARLLQRRCDYGSRISQGRRKREDERKITDNEGEKKRKEVEKSSKEEEKRRNDEVQKRIIEDQKRRDEDLNRRNRREEELRRQRKVMEEEKKRSEERMRRLAAIKLKEEESIRRVQENRRKEQVRKQNEKKREERMRISDERQQKKDDESGRRTRQPHEAGARGRKRPGPG